MLPLSKLWLFLVTLLSGLLLLLLLLLLPQLRRTLQDDQVGRVRLAQQTTALALTNSARQLVDVATQLGSDAILQSSLEELGRGQAEIDLLHRTAQEQLKKLNGDLRAAFLILTDARGRVLARIGVDEAVYRDPIDGFPIVSDAMRGYHLDDLWLLQGTLYRVAAAPVASPAHDRYVGAVLIGQVVGSELAREIRRLTGVDAVVLAGGQVVGGSLPRDRLDAVALLTQRDAAAGEVSRNKERDELLAFVDLPGEAQRQGAVLALVGAGSDSISLVTLLTAAAVRAGLPIGLLGGLLLAMAAAFALGLWLLYVEAERPLQRLQLALQGLSQRRGLDGAPGATATPLLLEEKHVRRSLRGLVRALNEALHWTPPPAAAPAGGGSAPAASGSPPDHAALPSQQTPLRALIEMPAKGTPAATAPPSAQSPGIAAPSSNFEETLGAAGPALPSGADDIELSFYRVYQEFVLARERCNEPVEGLNFDQFRKRLHQSRAQIISQHGCHDVLFQVQVRDGKTTLRATPTWR